jgi:hypothetical protein
VTLDSRPLPSANDLTANYGKFFTLIYIESDQRGRVTAHFTLYNLIGWRIILAEAGGSPLAKTALIADSLNPHKWSNDIADEIKFGSTWLDHAEFSLELTHLRLAEAADHHVQIVTTRQLEKIADRIFEKLGVTSADEAIPPDKLDELYAEMASQLRLIRLKPIQEESISPQMLEKILKELSTDDKSGINDRSQ